MTASNFIETLLYAIELALFVDLFGLFFQRNKKMNVLTCSEVRIIISRSCWFVYENLVTNFVIVIKWLMIYLIGLRSHQSHATWKINNSVSILMAEFIIISFSILKGLKTFSKIFMSTIFFYFALNKKRGNFLSIYFNDLDFF